MRRHIRQKSGELDGEFLAQKVGFHQSRTNTSVLNNVEIKMQVKKSTQNCDFH